MSLIALPYPLFTNGTAADGGQITADFSTIVGAINGGIDNTNIGAAGIFASQIKPTSSLNATFGGTVIGYTFLAAATSIVPLTVSGMAAQTADIFDVLLTSGGTNAFKIAASGAATFGFGVTATTVTGSGAGSFAGVAVGGALTGATTGAFSGAITSTSGGGYLVNTTGATTNNLYQELTNSGNDTRFGIENSAGGSIFASGSAYATVLGTLSARSLQLFANNILAMTIASTGTVSFVNGVNMNATSSSFLNAVSATTGDLYENIANTGNSTYLGVESSVGGTIFSGSAAYATVLGTTSARSLQFFTNNTLALTIASGGLATFAAGITVSTGNVTVNSGNGAAIGTAGGVQPGNETTQGTSAFFSGTGAPTFTAPNGSVYLRYDGTGGTDVLYINTSGPSSNGNTWAAKF